MDFTQRGIVKRYERLRRPRTKHEAKIWGFFLKASAIYDFPKPSEWTSALDVVYDIPMNRRRRHSNRFVLFLRLLTDLGLRPDAAAELTGFFINDRGVWIMDNEPKSVIHRAQMVRDSKNEAWARRFWKRYWDVLGNTWVP